MTLFKAGFFIVRHNGVITITAGHNRLYVGVELQEEFHGFFPSKAAGNGQIENHGIKYLVSL